MAEKKIDQYRKSNPQLLRDKIDHIVVLMLENRSFDNLLGWLYDGEDPPGGQKFEGLTEDLWNPLDNIDSDGIPFIEKVPIERNGQYKSSFGKEIPNPVKFTLPDPDPGEGFKDTNHQLFLKYNVGQLYPPKPINFGFVQNYQNAMLYGTYSFGDEPTNPRDIMKCYTAEQTPVLSTLAKNFAVLDNYHCSVPSQTIPNRDFVHAATSTGHVNNSPVASCCARTIFNQINEANRPELTWGIFGNNAFPNKKKDEAGRFGDDHFSLTRLIMTELHHPDFDKNFGTLDDFKTLCKNNQLPSYSFLEPNYSGVEQNDQHPPTDIRPGEQLIADVYNMIKDSKAFEKTMLIITYDEHGGTYDHVPPPGGAKNPEGDNVAGQDGFLFNRFGVRVPCVVVNPNIEKGLIARPYKSYIPFDHSSIIKTIQICFELEGHLTARDEAAPDFSGLLNDDGPRTGKDIPDVHPLEWNRADPNNELYVNDLHHVMADVLENITGNKKPPSGSDVLEFIQDNYQKLFGSSGQGISD